MTYLPPGITRITFDSNGVPRIRDTGIAVWEIFNQLHNETPLPQLLDSTPLLQTEDMLEISLYRIAELQEFLRHLGHDAMSQVNSIYGFAELVERGMIEPNEEHDLIANVFRGNAQILINLLVFTGHVLNGTTDRVEIYDQFRFPMRVREFLPSMTKHVAKNCEIVIESNENLFESDLLVLSDDGVQAALSELIRLSWFSRRFDNNCVLSLSVTDDVRMCLTTQRRLKQPGSLSFLTDWSLSPVPIAAFILEQRGGSLTCEVDDQTINFTIHLPLLAESER